jgi:hypothetical protein
MRLLPKPESRGDCKPADQEIEQAAGGEPQSRNDSKCRFPNNRCVHDAILYHAERTQPRTPELHCQTKLSLTRLAPPGIARGSDPV